MAVVNLAELLVSLVVSGFLLGSLVSTLDQGQRVYATGNARVEMIQNARVALNRMATDVRQAGRGPTPDSFPAISVAEPSRIVLQHDLDGNGVIAGAGETITWRLAGTILRRDAGGGAQPIINGVQDLTFTYLDGTGAVTTRLDAIRTIVIRLTATADHGSSALAAAAPQTVTTQVRLRNR